MSSAREEPGPTEPAPACLGALCPYPGPPCPPQTTVLGLGANQAVPGRRMSTRTNTGIHAYLSLVSEPVGCPYCLLFCVCLYSQVCNRLFVCLSFHDPVFFLPPSLCVLLSESDVTTGAAGVGGVHTCPLSLSLVRSRSPGTAAASPAPLQPPTPPPPPPALDLSARGASELSLQLETGAQQPKPAGTGSPHTRHLNRDSRLQNCSETQRQQRGRTRRTPRTPFLRPKCTRLLAAPSRDPELRSHSPLSFRRRCSPGAPRSPELTGAGVRAERAAVNPGR